MAKTPEEIFKSLDGRMFSDADLYAALYKLRVEQVCYLPPESSAESLLDYSFDKGWIQKLGPDFYLFRTSLKHRPAKRTHKGKSKTAMSGSRTAKHTKRRGNK